MQFLVKKINFDIQVSHCEIKEPKKFLKVHVAAIVVTCILTVFVVLGTCLEMQYNQHKVPSRKRNCKLLLSFSAVSNFQKLSSTKRSAGDLHFLHGFRFLSITWVVLGHCYFYPVWFMRSYESLFYAQKLASETIAQMIINGSEAVDSFFIMSGFLLGYLTVKHVIIDKKNFSVCSFILHRLWRIIPVYSFMVLFAMLLPLMGSGPLFHETMEESVYPCYDYWWRNLLFVNNFFHQKDVCMMHTWYVSSDMQLFLSSLLVLIPMFKSEVLGVTINVLIIIGSVVYSGILAYSKDIIPTITITHLDPADRNIGYLYLYANSLSRAGPYFIGILVGYMLAKNPNFKMSKKVQVAGWCVAILSSGCVVFLTCLWYEDGPRFIDTVMYATFYKVSYAAGIAWLMVCCATGHGGWINGFLSWKVWVPLSKLTFLIYLIQPMFQTMYIANFQSTEEQSHLHAIVHFFGYLCIAGLLAMLFNLLVESPCLALEKLMRPEKEKSDKTIKDEIVGETNYALSDDSFHSFNGKMDGLDVNTISAQFVDVSKL